VLGCAKCGVWQNTHISVVEVATTDPGPYIERLCFVPATPGTSGFITVAESREAVEARKITRINMHKRIIVFLYLLFFIIRILIKSKCQIKFKAQNPN
jgi:hypothetical protein